MKTQTNFVLKYISLVGFLSLMLFTEANAQCSDPLNLVVDAIDFPQAIDFSPWEQSCGCGQYNNCRLVNVSFEFDGISAGCRLVNFFDDNFSDGGNSILFINPDDCSMYPFSDVTFDQPVSNFSALICEKPNFNPPNSNIIVDITEGDCRPLEICNQDIKPDVHIEDGDVYLDESCRGVVFTSPDGNCYRMTVNNNGDLETTFVTCPN